ncbi:hypothetical protein KFK09_009649 [Dendrobium nobile]|uniref:Uncharacterized protein n=1 Tax=Dendrobium nobile TaxID=94219 RepID=A0A8T3BI16_DENNO|nr:hypothetical protein KFK09_009649 [Dendrobium nobile]
MTPLSSRLFKDVEPDDISIEACKCLGDKGICWLTKFFNIILKTKKMLDEWRMSVLIHIFKNKSDAQDCANYKGSDRARILYVRGQKFIIFKYPQAFHSSLKLTLGLYFFL